MDYKSHTGTIVSYGDGNGAVQSISGKKNLNTKSNTESKLVGVEEVSVMILWTKLFLEEQGYEINSSILYCKITRVLFCWKHMARKALGRGPEH